MAEIRINAEQWNAVSADDQNRIIGMLRDIGALRGDDRIVGDPSIDPFEEDAELFPEICKIACEAIAAAAKAACLANTTGPVLVACLAAAELAHEECLKRC